MLKWNASYSILAEYYLFKETKQIEILLNFINKILSQKREKSKTLVYMRQKIKSINAFHAYNYPNS